MKKIMIFLLFSLTVTSYTSGQISVTLNLPDPCTITAIDETAKKTDVLDFSINPNPSNGEFTLNISSKETLGKVDVEIVNMNGENVYYELIYCTGNSCIKSINLKQLPKGIYAISTRFKNTQKVKKLAIQ